MEAPANPGEVVSSSSDDAIISSDGSSSASSLSDLSSAGDEDGSDVSPESVTPVSPTEQMTAALLTLNLNMSKPGVREAVEKGLQAWNSIPNVCQTMVDAIKFHTDSNPDSIKMHFNPEIGLLSDFVQHCKLLISVNGLQPDASESIVDEVEKTCKGFIKQARMNDETGEVFRLTVDKAAFIKELGTQISLVLRIGEVFNVPVFTAYVMRDVFNNAVLDSDESSETVGPEFMHNAKLITNYSRLDVLLELLLHADSPDPYDTVNVLIARGINALFVSRFKEAQSPNAVIQTECGKFIALALTANDTVVPMITKSVLIAIIQNPDIETIDGKRFSDMFPSGQYVKYLGEVAYQSVEGQGPIMLPVKAAAQAPDEAPGSDVNALPTWASEVTEHPLTRTDIIVAALTAINAAMGSDANIVAAGGAAVSYYMNDFVRDLSAGAFKSVIAESGLDPNALEALKKGCDRIPMNDIDCFVFGKVSRQFLLTFSLYMMILYANFYERPRRYGVKAAVAEQVTSIQFNLSKSKSSDNIELFMYGNHNNDANTKLISKRLKKNPNVQLVTQEIMCFSQLMNAACGSYGDKCSVDGYYMQPIDLVKKDTEDFVGLYESLYSDGENKPDLKALLESQYSKGADNMVSLKTTMLDLVCIFCNEDKALFIRIFMARKNPKDFARLRAFIEIYLLQLLRFKSTDETFLKYKDALIGEIAQLRSMMTQLNDNYFLKQGNIAAAHDATAATVKGARDNFLVLLRSIGRKLVLIPDPLDNRIPATFKKETGMSTIRFFNSRPNPQIKYNFDMSQHMKQLYETYELVPIDSSEQPAIHQAYGEWLSGVFAEIHFTPETEAFFREKMGRILHTPQDGFLFTIDFDKMPVRSLYMLQLLHLLSGIKIDEANGANKAKLKQLNKFTILRRNLLGPLRNVIAEQGGVTPKSTYVIKLYDKSIIDEYLLALVKYALLNDKLKGEDANSGLMKTVDEPANYDDAVREEIGRILLEWNARVPPRALGGSTRKRKRSCKFIAKTRSNRRSGARSGARSGNCGNTRRKIKTNNIRCKRTRRA